MKTNMNIVVSHLMFVLIVILSSALPVQAMPGYHGRLLNPNTGQPVTDGQYSLFFRFFATETGGEPLWEEHHSLQVADGMYDVALGSVVKITDPVMRSENLWLEVQMQGGQLFPRLRISSTIFSIRSGDADTLDGTDSSGFLKSTGGTMTGLLNLPANGLSVGSSQFTISNGKVGIGTTTPQDKLDVSGGMVTLDSGPENSIAGIRIREKGDMRWTMLYRSWEGDNLHIYDEVAHSSTMTFQSNTGRVGIGVLEPQAKLDVQGSIKAEAISTGIILTPPGSSGSYEVYGVKGTASSNGETFGLYGVADRIELDIPGHPTSEPSPSYGVYGRVQPKAGSGRNTVNTYGVFGQNINGLSSGYLAGDRVGVRGDYRVGTRVHKYGMLGTSEYGVYAENSSGTALYAVAKKEGETAIHAVATGDGFAGLFEGALRITGGSDLSEPFNIQPLQKGSKPLPGMLVSIDTDKPGQLVVSSEAYDRKVAGVISGAGGIKPGMLMGQNGTIADGTNPVALSGRIYCLADADLGVIKPGDLLTTSKTPGHAMLVTDYSKAQGAVIGKAMTALEKGKGLVLVLVSLQ